MFTTGSKLFLGATVTALIGAVVFGVFTDGDIAWTATIGLIGATLALGLLSGINFFVRDGNVRAFDPGALTESPAAQHANGASMWPLVAAVGGGLVVLGLVTEPVVFKAGIVVLLAAGAEWVVQNWSDRASADREYNDAIRKRMLHPLEFPVLAAVGIAVIVFSFSRIMLFVSKETGPAIFGILGALIVLVGYLFATRASVRKSVVAGVCTIAALGLVSTGVVMAIDGSREIEEYEIIETSPQVCSSNDKTEADRKSSQSIAAKSNVAATLIFQDGRLYAETIGFDGTTDTITLPAGNPSNIVFRNLDPTPVRLTASLGAFETTTLVNGKPTIDKPVTCTALVKQNAQQFMTLVFPRSSRWSLEPYTLFVPGVDGAVVKVVVP
jgi:hypothetical protein